MISATNVLDHGWTFVLLLNRRRFKTTLVTFSFLLNVSYAFARLKWSHGGPLDELV
jgi:hypothetical protein